MTSPRKPKPAVTVVIPTLNNIRGRRYLTDYFKDKPYKAIFVDNSKVNLGFAAGVNKGVKEARSEWLLILNDDIEFKDIKGRGRSKEIDDLLIFAKRNGLDAVTPVLRNPNGSVENVGYRVLPFGKVELVTAEVEDDSGLDGITAACLLVKADVFRRLKGFDESFFAYLEDVDFFLRFKKQGFKFAVAFDIEVHHNHMTTSKTMGNFKARQDLINWWRLYFKHKNRFVFNLAFILERLRNLSGFIKATVSQFL